MSPPRPAGPYHAARGATAVGHMTGRSAPEACRRLLRRRSSWPRGPSAPPGFRIATFGKTHVRAEPNGVDPTPAGGPPRQTACRQGAGPRGCDALELLPPARPRCHPATRGNCTGVKGGPGQRQSSARCGFSRTEAPHAGLKPDLPVPAEVHRQSRSGISGRLRPSGLTQGKNAAWTRTLRDAGRFALGEKQGERGSGGASAGSNRIRGPSPSAAGHPDPPRSCA